MFWSVWTKNFSKGHNSLNIQYVYQQELSKCLTCKNHNHDLFVRYLNKLASPNEMERFLTDCEQLSVLTPC